MLNRTNRLLFTLGALALVASCGNESTTLSSPDLMMVCTAPQTSCGNVCVDLTTDGVNCGACGKRCDPDYVCAGGHCILTCTKGLTLCEAGDGGAKDCINLQRDNANCGKCGSACPPGNVCSMGQCGLSCQQGLTTCNGTCVNLGSDTANCGKCGTVCPMGDVCSNAVCAVSCQPGLTNCNGACANLLNDNANCGMCGAACPTGQVCSKGVCSLSCQMSLTTCGGICTNLQSDIANCGMCGTVCPMGNVCSSGQCAVSCQQGLTSCNALCVNLQTDNGNCGMCGIACPMGNVCSNGVCGLTCQQSLTSCHSVCVNLVTDNGNCGECGVVCPMGQVCNGSKCGVTCPQSWNLCNGACSNPTTDDANCGGCGAACAQGKVCSMGQCLASCGMPLVSCNLMCIDPRFDPANCGKCGALCPRPVNGIASCVNGNCGLGACDASFRNCDGIPANGCPINVTNDLNNCGKCGGTCGAVANATPTCQAGVCKAQCANNFADCDGQYANGCEVNLTTDSNNCGKCGNVCGNGRQCSNSACIVSDPCVNYGGLQIAINQNLRVCKQSLTWGAWNPQIIAAPWTVCTLSQWMQYAPGGTPASFGLQTLWINNSSCNGGHHEVYVSYPMNQQSCYDGSSCCWPDNTTLQFAICSP